jgi:uncharacterized membrane protein
MLQAAAQESSDIGNLVLELVRIRERVNHDDSKELKSSLILLPAKKLIIGTNLFWILFQLGHTITPMILLLTMKVQLFGAPIRLFFFIDFILQCLQPGRSRNKPSTSTVVSITQKYYVQNTFSGTYLSGNFNALVKSPSR